MGFFTRIGDKLDGMADKAAEKLDEISDEVRSKLEKKRFSIVSEESDTGYDVDELLDRLLKLGVIEETKK